MSEALGTDSALVAIGRHVALWPVDGLQCCQLLFASLCSFRHDEFAHMLSETMCTHHSRLRNSIKSCSSSVKWEQQMLWSVNSSVQREGTGLGLLSHCTNTTCDRVARRLTATIIPSWILITNEEIPQTILCALRILNFCALLGTFGVSFPGGRFSALRLRNAPLPNQTTDTITVRRATYIFHSVIDLMCPTKGRVWSCGMYTL